MRYNLKYQTWIDEMTEQPCKKIYWVETARRNTLAARVEVGLQVGVGISEQDMDPIQKWCEEHRCGRRISFDMIQFKSKKHITMFLLRWG